MCDQRKRPFGAHEAMARTQHAPTIELGVAWSRIFRAAGGEYTRRHEPAMTVLCGSGRCLSPAGQRPRVGGLHVLFAMRQSRDEAPIDRLCPEPACRRRRCGRG